MSVLSHARKALLGEQHRPGWFCSLWPQPSQTPGPEVWPTESPAEPGATGSQPVSQKLPAVPGSCWPLARHQVHAQLKPLQ